MVIKTKEKTKEREAKTHSLLNEAIEEIFPFK